MKSTIRKIDRAIKRLYHLDTSHCAEDFLLSEPSSKQVSVANAGMRGALVIDNTHPDDLSLGIYLDAKVRGHLARFTHWPRHWSREQLEAFTIAVEEVSHFHCLVFHAQADVPVTQLELELQGEIDKFLLAFYTLARVGHTRPTLLEALCDQIFFHFSLVGSLSVEQKERYREANRLAKRFVRKNARALIHSMRDERTFRTLRRFYRLTYADKISTLCG